MAHLTNFVDLNLHSHDLRVHVGSLSRFKLSLPQCNVPGVLNCMSGRLSGCSGENNLFHITNFSATYSILLCCINIIDYNRLTFDTREQ